MKMPILFSALLLLMFVLVSGIPASAMVDRTGLGPVGQAMTDSLATTPSPQATPEKKTITATPQPAVDKGIVSPTPQAVANQNNLVPFSLLGYSERTLRGPFDSSGLWFWLPSDWVLTDGAQIQLSFDTFFNGTGAPQQNPSPSRGKIEVRWNYNLLTTITLDQSGERTFTIPIPADLLTSKTQTDVQGLQLLLDSMVDCDYDWHTTVVVHPTSKFVFPHRVVPPLTDLRILPRPIYQGSFAADTAMVVVPDKPTVSELQSALSIAAGFGQMSNGKLNLTLVPVSQLTKEVQAASQLILVGKPATLPMLKQLNLPSAPNDSGWNVAGAGAEDGVIQMAISPWNPSRVVLVVSGNTDAAIVKAAQAISFGVVKVSPQPNLALVADVHPNLQSSPAAVDRTLANLGYSNVTLQDLGGNISEIRFYVPPGQAPNSDAYWDLVFNHSAMLDYNRAGLLVRLNDEPVGSVRFTDETAKQGIARIPLPRSSIRAGVNRITVETDLIPRFTCLDPHLSLLWITLRSESVLHLPLGPVQDKDLQRVIDLSTYPDVFALDPTLSTTAFVLPANDPQAWRQAARLAFDLGSRRGIAMADLIAVFGDGVSDSVRKSRDLLIVGHPSDLPIVAQLHDVLPAPFEPGSDLAVERNMRVVYRILPGSSVGYLQVLAAPWSEQRVVWAVLGNDSAGLESVVNALTVSRLRAKLSGNYAFLNGEQIVVGDTRVAPIGSGLTPTTVISSPGTAPQDAPSTSTGRLGWTLPALGISVGLMVIVLLGLAYAAIARRGK